MLVTPSFSEVQDDVTPGEYTVRISSVEVGEWPARDNRPAIKHLQLRMETFDEAEPKNNGRAVFDRVAIEGKGAFRLQQLAKATHTSVEGGFNTEDFLGKELKVVVDKDSTGQYTNVKSFGMIG